jgi:para-nitrobenzyl esterase
MQSGAGLNGTLPEAGTETAKAIMKKLNITDPRKLQEVPPEDLLKALAVEPGAPRMGGPLGFSPVVDGQFLPTHPFDPVAPPTAAGLPIIIGTNRDEMLLMMIMDPKRKKLTEQELIERIRPRTREKTDEILATYRKSRPDASPWDLLVAIISEPFRRRSIALAERKAAASNDPVYMYLFDFEVNSALKAAHAMEIPFVFSNTHLMRYFRRPETKDVESRISEAWIAFARTGNPNHPGLPEWPTYTADTRATMIFDANSHVVNDPRKEERLSWEGLDMEMAVVP